MPVSSQSITTEDGITFYLDSINSRRFYSLPTHLDLAKDDEGNYRFSLLFYQEDFPERGARLVMVLNPVHPQLNPEGIANTVGADAEIIGIPFEDGEIQIIWPEFMTTPGAVTGIMNGRVHLEIGLSQVQASTLRQLFDIGAENVRVRARMAYGQTTEPLPAKAHINLHQAATELNFKANEEIVTGKRLRALIAGLSESAIKLQGQREVTLPPRPEFMWKSAPFLAPLIAASMTEMESDGLTFDDRTFRLLRTDQIEDAEIWLDLSRPRPWINTWQGEWSLSDFRKQVEADGKVKQYFPEVLKISPVELVPVLVENLLTITPETVQEVQITLKYHRLGSLEEDIFDTRFTPNSPPVIRHNIPTITFTPFRYHYKVRLLVAPENPEAWSEALPLNPQWEESDQPLVRIDKQYLPYAIVYASARAGVFQSVGRADIEIAAADVESPVVLGHLVLTVAHTTQSLLIRSLPSSSQKIRWRPVLYQDAEGISQPLIGEWRTENKLWAILDTWDVFPRNSKKIMVVVYKGNTPEIRLVTVQLQSGSQLERDVEPDVSQTFFHDGNQTFTLWPESIFDQDFIYRYGVTLPEGEYWSAWQIGEGDKVELNIEGKFYTMRTVEVTMQAPWSESRSPDSSSRKGEIIYAEVNLKYSGTSDTQSKSLTFDADNKGTQFKWDMRVRQGAEEFSYEVYVLSIDGRLINLGTYKTGKEKLKLEIFRTYVSDVAPAKFDIRELD
jgi:hypothetical protein